MAKKPARDHPQNTEIKLAICKWKLYTGQAQQDLAEQIGISQSQLSQILGGFRPGHGTLSESIKLSETSHHKEVAS